MRTMWRSSFILKIKAAEIVYSGALRKAQSQPFYGLTTVRADQYALGFTMRFPRAMMIRDDLSVADCMTASAVLESLKLEKKRKLEGNGE